MEVYALDAHRQAGTRTLATEHPAPRPLQVVSSLSPWKTPGGGYCRPTHFAYKET